MRFKKTWFSLFLAFVLCLCMAVPAQASGIDTLTLYANWKASVTFDANGGTLSGGVTAEERALVGRSSGTLQINVGQTASTGLTGTKANNLFVRWNTRPDGTGIRIEEYGPITGPVTFYALYYQTDYYYTGNYQTFNVPITGWYSVQMYGAQGGRYGLQSDTQGCSWGGVNLTTEAGLGAYTSGSIHLNAGDTLYVYVGGKGGDRNYATGGAFNGGGSTTAGGGGGATDLRTQVGNLDSRIMVAAGGGGASKWGNGGNGGTQNGTAGFYMEHSGSNDPTGITYTASATQNGGASFGNGGSTSIRGGGGGGGWYGGYAGRVDGSGGGGSSYISGWSFCNGRQTTSSGYTFTNCAWSSGVRTGNGYARIVLTSEG